MKMYQVLGVAGSVRCDRLKYSSSSNPTSSSTLRKKVWSITFFHTLVGCIAILFHYNAGYLFS